MGIFDFFKGNSDTIKIDLSDFKFISNDHIRYENGRDVSGHNYDCWRGVRVQNNIAGGQGYTVTIYNLDGNHQLWGNNIQMAPKQMRIIEQTASDIKLKGYGSDPIGNSFADYGLTLHLKNNQVDTVSLHMYDRNVEIVYYKDAVIKRSTNNLETLFSLSDSISNSNGNKLILTNANELKSLVLGNKQIFEIDVTKELYDAMEKSYKALLKAIPLSTNSNERYELVTATYFILSTFRAVSPGNGNVCEDKIRLLVKHKADIIKLFQSIDAKMNAPSDPEFSYDLLLYFLLNDNTFMLDYNADLKALYNHLKSKYAQAPNGLHLGEMTEKRYYALMLK